MTAQPVAPRDAATVILVRQPEGAPWECFMVRRHIGSDFAPDVYVFPGGKVEDADRSEDVLPHIAEALLTPTDVDFEDRDLGFRMAALRELFEEAGVLLAEARDGAPLDRLPVPPDGIDLYRERLRSGDITLVAFAAETGIRLLPGLLIPFARWITPRDFGRRYDTRFFIALLPAGQEPLHDAVETTHGLWIAPRTALQLHARGEFPLVFATERQLDTLALFESIPDLVASVTPAGLQPIMPKVVQRDGEQGFLLPGDEGYDDA